MNKKFIPGRTYIPVSGKVYGKEEVDNAIKAAKDGWWTEGRFAKQFETNFKKYLGVSYVTLVNSGSSANLLAVASLTSSSLGERMIKPGDEFITTSASFPTTVNPGIQYGLTPVFIDIDINTLNIDITQIEKAITKKTKFIMLAHTLGLPFQIKKVVNLCRRYNLWLIEDCCDALGSTYDHKNTGTFGDMATFSFYPAHQITMGEGGAVATKNPLLYRANRQFRDWGRDCWCDTGRDDTCKKRFKWQLGELPYGYDHKYIYSQIGYNLKLTDFQAAVGVAQLKRLKRFITKRRQNYFFLNTLFSKYTKYFILPKQLSCTKPSYFGFPLIVRKTAPFSRNTVVEYLEKNKIGTRNLFAGNLLRHPAYLSLKKEIVVIGDQKNADYAMNNAFWIGVYPGIDAKRRRYIKKTIQNFLKTYESLA